MHKIIGGTIMHVGSTIKTQITNTSDKMEEGDNSSRYIALIKKYFPKLNIEKCDIITSGFCSIAIIVNDELVFRFPLKEEFAMEYIKEKEILDRVRPYITTQIPNINIVGNDGELFSMHRIIKGIQYGKLTDGQKEVFRENLAKDIALFVAQLHSVPIDEGEPIDKFIMVASPLCRELDMVKRHLGDRRRIHSLERAIKYAASKDHLPDRHTVLNHNDLTEFNILVNPETGRLAGVIDFANASIRGNYVDFAALHDFYFVEEIAQRYTELTGSPIDLEYALSIQKIRYAETILDCLTSAGKESKLKSFEGWLEDLVKFDQRTLTIAAKTAQISSLQ